jgi:hypothetical protein
MKRTTIARADYPKRFLERYGRMLTSDEIRLVKAYRGLAPDDQAKLRRVAAETVMARARGGAR